MWSLVAGIGEDVLDGIVTATGSTRAEGGLGSGMAQFSYRRHRFPPTIIQHAIWLYLRFTLSYRDVEELLAERRLDVSYETVRRWVLKLGPLIARELFAPSMLVTDKLGSYGAAFRALGLSCPHRQAAGKQSGRELPSDGPETRAQDAAVQIGPLGPAISQHACRRPQHLQSPAAPRLPNDPADLQSRSSSVAAGRRRRMSGAHGPISLCSASFT